jgi:hypothetical protein
MTWSYGQTDKQTNKQTNKQTFLPKLTLVSDEFTQRIKISTQSSCKLATAVASDGAASTNNAMAAMTLHSSIRCALLCSFAGAIIVSKQLD